MTFISFIYEFPTQTSNVVFFTVATSQKLTAYEFSIYS